MNTESNPTPERIMALGLGFWGSKVLLSAVELKLFSALAQTPRTAGELAEGLGLQGRGSLDFLDTLVSLGMLERENGRYQNTPESDLFLDEAKATYIGGMLEMANERLYPFWGSLTEGLKSGLPQNEIKTGQGGLFESIYGDPHRLRLFLGAMTGLSMGAAMAIAEKFPWHQYQTFVDVGGAQGGTPVAVAKAHAQLKGLNFDLPVVGPVFEEYVASHGLANRLRFQAGDFFNEPFPEADVIIMGHILHDWSLEDKKMLIGKAYEALPQGGAYIVFEGLIDDERRSNTFGLLMSLNMLIETPAGFDFTGADCRSWLHEAGFRETRVEHLAGPDSMVVGIK